MRKRYKAVIFDLDGTLLDTLDDLTEAVNYALGVYGLPCRTRGDVRRFVGNGVARLIERALPIGEASSISSEVLARFKEYYSRHDHDHTAPYDGIPSLLEELSKRNIPIAVVSNKIDAAVSSLCRRYFGDVVDIAVGERENVRKKPAPDSVNEVLRALNLKPHEVVYVGDSEVDIETAQNAGIDCISVTWGFRDLDILCRAWAIDPSVALSETKGFSAAGISGCFAFSTEELKKILTEDKD